MKWSLNQLPMFLFIKIYATENGMKINHKKSKFMVFNPTLNYDFIPEYESEGYKIETVEEMKILGLVVRNDLKWRSNTEGMIRKAYKRMWMIKRLKAYGANLQDMLEVYTKQIRCVLEYGVPVWNSSVTKEKSYDIERVQKCFLHIVLGSQYLDYEYALKRTGLDSLKSRRLKLCTTFAQKSAKHPKFKHWFVPQLKLNNTRSKKPLYKPPMYRLERFNNSPIPYLTRLLNSK